MKTPPIVNNQSKNLISNKTMNMKAMNEQNYDLYGDWVEEMSQWEPYPDDLFLDEEIYWADNENTSNMIL